ncbi:hypothetical protein DIPPA_27836 [Diplonema papillatum]|nr:hypothetical protein DIPPA_27836 [Diplonema papillatum]
MRRQGTQSSVLRMESEVARLEEIAAKMPSTPRRAGAKTAVAAREEEEADDSEDDGMYAFDMRRRFSPPKAKADGGRTAQDEEIAQLKQALNETNLRVSDLERDLRNVLACFHLTAYDMQHANESPDPRSRIRLLHSLPAFHAIVKNVDLLRDAVSAQHTVQKVQHQQQQQQQHLAAVTRAEYTLVQPPEAPTSPPPGGVLSYHAQAPGTPGVARVVAPGGGGCVIGADVADDSRRGARIVRVRPTGPCELAGVFANDVVTAVEGKPVGNVAELQARLAGYAPGNIVTLMVLRHGSLINLPLMLGPNPSPIAAVVVSPVHASPPPPSSLPSPKRMMSPIVSA